MSPRLATFSAAAVGAALITGGMAYAALYPGSQIFGRVLVSGKDPRQLALTFDDGPNPTVTPQILDLLALNGAKATFFLIGTFVRRHPRLARAVLEAGHLVGNHTMTHPRLAWQSAKRIRREIVDANALLEDVLGTRVRHFRPPHGARRPYVIEVANELGLTTVQWNVTASDWKPIPAQEIVANVERGIARNKRKGRSSNILLHDGGHLSLGADRLATLRATAQLLRRDSGESFVTIDRWQEAQR